MGEKGTLGYRFIQSYLAESNGLEIDAVDHDRAFNPKTGQNAYWDEDQQQWRDAKTGQPLSGSGTRSDKEWTPPRGRVGGPRKD